MNVVEIINEVEVRSQVAGDRATASAGIMITVLKDRLDIMASNVVNVADHIIQV